MYDYRILKNGEAINNILNKYKVNKTYVFYKLNETLFLQPLLVAGFSFLLMAVLLLCTTVILVSILLPGNYQSKQRARTIEFIRVWNG